MKRRPHKIVSVVLLVILIAGMGMACRIQSLESRNKRWAENTETAGKILTESGKKEVTLELAEQALKDIVAPNENKQITADYIISMVAEHFNVSTADLCGNKRSSKIVMPRQVAMYLCREILAIPLKNVGQYLGNRDHTTVMHGVEKIEKELQTNEQLQSTIDTLKKKINPQT